MTTKPDYTQLYEIAESQTGYFTSAQARQAGFSWERLSANGSAGKFLRVARGVYRLVQFPGSAFEDLFVAWLRVGSKAVISHDSALAVFALTDVLPGEVHVIVPRTASRRHPGIHLHTNLLLPDEITSREGLVVTTVARTIADVAASYLAEELVYQAIREAIARGLLTEEELHVQAKRRKGRAKRMIEQILNAEKLP
jgi:predicted transcriptional regulator of viral defense system